MELYARFIVKYLLWLEANVQVAYLTATAHLLELSGCDHSGRLWSSVPEHGLQWSVVKLCDLSSRAFLRAVGTNCCGGGVGEMVHFRGSEINILTHTNSAYIFDSWIIAHGAQTTHRRRHTGTSAHIARTKGTQLCASTPARDKDTRGRLWS